MSTLAALHRMFSTGSSDGPNGPLERLFFETTGEDIVEYALLTAFIGFAGAAAWNAMRTSLGTAYVGLNASVWNLWEPADPVGGGS